MSSATDPSAEKPAHGRSEASTAAAGARRGGLSLLLRQSLRGDNVSLTDGSVPRSIVLLAIPMVLEMAMESIFAVADVFFVARLGSDAVAAVGLTEALLILVYALGFGLGAPATAIVARRIGQRRPDDAAEAAVQCLIVGLAVSVIIGIPGAWTAPWLLRALGASPEVVDIGAGYASLLLAGNATILLLFLNGAILRGAGDASAAMRALWIANGINLVLDPCLLFGWGPFPELGLFGAAVATTIGRGIGALYQLACLTTGWATRIRVRTQHWRLNPQVIREILRMSVGGIGQNLVETASWLLLVRIVALLGSATVAGYTVAMRVLMFALLPGWGVANAAATLVGQNLGAGKPDRAERAVWLSCAYNTVFLGVFAVSMILWAEPIIGWFTTEADVRESGGLCLRVIAYGYVMYGWGMVAVQAFNGAGDTTTPLWLNIVCFWAIKLPLAYVLALPLGLGAHGIWSAVTLAYCANAVLGLLLFKWGRWKLRPV